MLQDLPSSKAPPRYNKTQDPPFERNPFERNAWQKSAHTSHKKPADTKMPKTNRPSGNWGDTQKQGLRALVDANEIGLARKDSKYLWEICI
jgi:hypothetical protein